MTDVSEQALALSGIEHIRCGACMKQLSGNLCLACQNNERVINALRAALVHSFDAMRREIDYVVHKGAVRVADDKREQVTVSELYGEPASGRMLCTCVPGATKGNYRSSCLVHGPRTTT